MSPTAPLKRGSALPSTNPRHRQRPKAPRPQGPMGANSAAHHPSPPDDAVPWNNGRPSVSGSDAGWYFLYQCNLGNVRSATSQRTDSHTVPPPVQPRRRSRDCDTQHWILIVSGNASHYLSLLGSSRQSERDPTGGPAACAGVEEPSSTLEMNLNPNRQKPPGAQAVVCF